MSLGRQSMLVKKSWAAFCTSSRCCVTPVRRARYGHRRLCVPWPWSSTRCETAAAAVASGHQGRLRGRHEAAACIGTHGGTRTPGRASTGPPRVRVSEATGWKRPGRGSGDDVRKKACRLAAAIESSARARSNTD